ncbi:MAG: hypothetical protein WCR29_06025 [Bacteroidales bacterium]|nr:hypothetical protein [Bacteroidales bacterium]
MRKHFVWVQLIILFTMSISFTACSKKESKEIIAEKATISVEGVKVAWLSDDGNIVSGYSEAKVIQRFNDKNPGFCLEKIQVDDNNKASIDSNATLSLFVYDSLKNKHLTFGVYNVMKVLDENKNLIYILHKEEILDIFED